MFISYTIIKLLFLLILHKNLTKNSHLSQYMYQKAKDRYPYISFTENVNHFIDNTGQKKTPTRGALFILVT